MTLLPFVVVLVVFARAQGEALLDWLRVGNKSILAFGDSLTRGHIRHHSLRNVTYRPYTIKLGELINKDASSPLEINERGQDGERTMQMEQRLPQVMNSIGGNIGLVIILGGTNDLAVRWNSWDDVVESLKRLHQSAHAHGAKTIAITMPDCLWTHSNAAGTEKYIKVNDAVRQMNVTLPDGVVGVFDTVPVFNPQNSPETKSFWTHDLIHLSEEGYAKMGS